MEKRVNTEGGDCGLASRSNMLGSCGKGQQQHDKSKQDMGLKLTSAHRVTWKMRGKQNANGNYAAV